LLAANQANGMMKFYGGVPSLIYMVTPLVWETCRWRTGSRLGRCGLCCWQKVMDPCLPQEESFPRCSPHHAAGGKRHL